MFLPGFESNKNKYSWIRTRLNILAGEAGTLIFHRIDFLIRLIRELKTGEGTQKVEISLV
jgi:hypothetical protein